MLDDILDIFGGTAGRILGLGLALGAGVALGRGGGRPLVKSAVKGYIAATDRIREVTAEAAESLQDVYAEVKAEQDQARQAAEAETETQIVEG